MAAEGIGVDGLHCISGTCDLCGEACDANTQELNVLTCTFKNCQDLPYHQDCLEKYLKSIRLERNRKTGFKCPRGCGKGTKHPDPCPGKIDKSHPIHPRNEEQKKKKKAKLPELLAAAPARQIKTKEEKKQEKEKAKAAAPAAAAAAADKAKAAKAAAAKPPAAPAAATPKVRPAQPDPKQQQQKLAEAKAAALRELAAASRGGKNFEQQQQQQREQAAFAQQDFKTLDAYYRESGQAGAPAAATPAVNAWAKPPVPAPHALGAGQLRPRPAEPNRLQSVATGREAPAAAPAAAAAAAVGLPPPPPPPPPAGSHPLHTVPSIHSHPLQTQGSSASLLSQTSGANGAQLPVGAEYVGEDEAQHLTKAQRKNLKRAEKKKRGTLGDVPTSIAAAAGNQAGASPAAMATAAATPAGPLPAAAAAGAAAAGKASRPATAAGSSSGGGAGAGSAAASLSRGASSTSDSLAAMTTGPAGSAAGGDADEDADDDGSSTEVMYDLAVQALLAHKTLALVASLQRLGFTEWQAAAAVQRHGSDLEDAVAWLLEGGAPSAEAAASVSAGCVADVSIGDELRLMEALAAALPQLPKAQLYCAVADAGGDLDQAAGSCLQRHAEIVAAQAEAAEAAEAEAAAAAAAAEAAAAEAAAAAAAATAAASSAAGESPLATASLSTPTSVGSSQQQRQAAAAAAASGLPNGLSSLDSPGFSTSLGLYTPSSPAAAAVPASFTPAAVTGSGFGSWSFVPHSTGLGQQPVAHPLDSLPSCSSFGLAGGQLEPSGSGLGSYLPSSATAATAAGVGSSIWGANSVDASSSSWGQLGQAAAAAQQQQQPPGDLLSGAASSSLFGPNGLHPLGGWGPGAFHTQSGLGLLQGQQPLSLADPVLGSFAAGGMGNAGNSSSLFAASDLLPPAGHQQAAPAAVDAGLQQSRLFSSYGVSQPSLFGGSTAQHPQSYLGSGLGIASGAGTGVPADSADAEDDLEGLMATLMCH